MLTGYLKCRKPWDKNYYRSIAPIIVSYVLISAIHLLYKTVCLYESKSAAGWVLEFLDFKLADYSWYVGMYIRLFLLSPLLNVLWSSLNKKKLHVAAIVTLMSVTFLVSTVNSIGPDSREGANLLPAYFTQIYYITYYVIGCFLRTYRPQVNRWLCISGVLSLTALQAVVNIITRSDPANYYSGYSASYSNLLLFVMAVLLFLATYRLQSSRERIRRIAKCISGAVLEMYLLSYLFDSNIYVMFPNKYSMRDYGWVGLIMTSAVFLLSFMIGNR